MKSHFWIGWFESLEIQEEYFKETYTEDDDAPISKFASDQHVSFYDHDFLEIGFKTITASIRELFEGHSYSEYWLEELENRTKGLSLQDVNTIVFINSEEIEDPRPCFGNKYRLKYLGEIEYDVSHD